jgi:putative transposase
MKFDPQKHHRRSIRLKNYDYSQGGAYYITIVTYRRASLFGRIVSEEMQLSDCGKIADECWRAIPEHFPNFEVDAYVIMPNHIHGILVTHEIGLATWSPSAGARHASPLRPHGVEPGSVGAIVGSFKSAVTKRIGREIKSTSIWQRNYYEHVIRDERDLKRIQDYIQSNPANWEGDKENSKPM